MLCHNISSSKLSPQSNPIQSFHPPWDGRRNFTGGSLFKQRGLVITITLGMNYNEIKSVRRNVF